MRVDIWSDLVCPWCYLGKRRFEKALEAFEHSDDVESVHRSFQLDPSMPKGQPVRARDMLMRKYRMSEPEVVAAQEQLVQLAAVDGLEYHLDSYTGNTMDAHRLVHLGREQGIQDAVIERLFRGHFTENRSLFDHESLAALGTGGTSRYRGTAGRHSLRTRGHRRPSGSTRAGSTWCSFLRLRWALWRVRRPVG